MLKKLTLASMLILASTATYAKGFELSSPDIQKGKAIPKTFAFNSFGCTGDNVSPALNWKNAPAETKSFAIMVHDPDAKTGAGGFRHWVVINLPASSNGIAKGVAKPGLATLPDGGDQITTDFGTQGWGGPCPPAGDTAHHYQFTVYALKVAKLELPANATAGLAGLHG